MLSRSLKMQEWIMSEACLNLTELLIILRRYTNQFSIEYKIKMKTKSTLLKFRWIEWLELLKL